MLIVGVTGGIGSGKSTAARILGELGAYVFDADQVAKELIETNRELQLELIDEFMDDIIDSTGEIVKSKLARIGFSNLANQEMLNEIIHPFVIQANEDKIEKLRQQNGAELYVVDAPLLFEANMDQRCDYTILVYTRLNLRLQRALKRGTLTRDEILRRMDLQMPEEEKMELANYVIDNNSDEAHLRQEVIRIYREISQNEPLR